MLAQADVLQSARARPSAFKKNAKHELLQFSRIWCNGPVETAVTARVRRGECDGGLSFTTICTAHVSATAQATYRRCLPWAAAVRRESSVASNERVRDSILLTRHLPFSITSSPFLAIFRNALTDTSGGGAASAELRTTRISGDQRPDANPPPNAVPSIPGHHHMP